MLIVESNNMYTFVHPNTLVQMGMSFGVNCPNCHSFNGRWGTKLLLSVALQEYYLLIKSNIWSNAPNDMGRCRKHALGKHQVQQVTGFITLFLVLFRKGATMCRRKTISNAQTQGVAGRTATEGSERTFWGMQLFCLDYMCLSEHEAFYKKDEISYKS